MIHPRLSRSICINYHILKRLVQNDVFLNRKVTKTTILELSDAKKFYEKHLKQDLPIEHFPMLYKLIERETNAAFKRLSKKLIILNRYEIEYPSALWQDLKDEAPMFLYLSGSVYILDRKVNRLAFFTTPNSQDEYLQKSLNLVQSLKGKAYTVILQFNTLLEHLMLMQFQKDQMASLVMFRGPITKDIESAIKKFDLMFKRGKKGLNILSITSPFNEVTDEKTLIKIMHSLSKISILFSRDHRDAQSFSVSNNLSWKKPSMMPLIDGNKMRSSELLYTIKEDQDFIKHIERCL